MRLVLAVSLGAITCLHLFLDARAGEALPIIDLETAHDIQLDLPKHESRKYSKITAAPDNVIDFSARHYPFTPKLLASKDPSICHSFEKAVQTYFITSLQNTRHDQNFGWGALVPGTFDIEGGRWLGGEDEVILVPAKSNQEAYAALIKRQGYIHMSLMATLYTKPGKMTKEEAEKLFGDNIPNDDELGNAGWNAVTSARTYENVPLHLLWMNSTLYLYKNGKEANDSSVTPDEAENTVGLYSIEPDGKLIPVCTVLAAPTTEIASPPFFRDRDKVKAEAQIPIIRTPPILKNFFDATDEVSGKSLNDQSCEGTNGPYVWAGYYANRGAVRYSALVRPWELNLNLESNTLVRFLNQWGADSLHNYRIYQRIIDRIPEATETLADFYQVQYDLSKGKSYLVAENVMGRILDASLITHASNDPEVKAAIETDGDADAFRQRYREALADEELLSLQIRKAVLFGMTDLIQDTSKEQLIEPDEELANARYFNADHLLEPLMFYSLDNKKMLNLLIDKGLDVNSKNWFGKTPLMYAAQWNMPEIVNMFLKHHADINIATKPHVDKITDCSGAPFIGERTALMYAAENASAPLIENMLKAGADAKAKDSKGRIAQDYLANNKLLSDSERKRIIVLLGNKQASNPDRQNIKQR